MKQIVFFIFLCLTTQLTAGEKGNNLTDLLSRLAITVNMPKWILYTDSSLVKAATAKINFMP